MTTPCPPSAWSLLAQAGVGRSVESWWRRSSLPGESALLLAVVFAVAVVWAGLSLWEWWRRRSHGGPAGSKDEALFEQLCRAHGLSGGEAQRLRDVAREQSIDPPAALFIDPRPLDDGRDRDALAALRRKLFGDVDCAASGQR